MLFLLQLALLAWVPLFLSALPLATMTRKPVIKMQEPLYLELRNPLAMR